MVVAQVGGDVQEDSVVEEEMSECVGDGGG